MRQSVCGRPPAGMVNPCGFLLRQQTAHSNFRDFAEGKIAARWCRCGFVYAKHIQSRCCPLGARKGFRGRDSARYNPYLSESDRPRAHCSGKPTGSAWALPRTWSGKPGFLWRAKRATKNAPEFFHSGITFIN
jgi:hypothetical protein